MVRTRFALILYFRMVAHKAACNTLSKAFFEINEDMVQILLMLEVLFLLMLEVLFAQGAYCKRLSKQEKVVMHSRPQCSPDRTLCDFFWFSRLKNTILVENLCSANTGSAIFQFSIIYLEKPMKMPSRIGL